ncbi:MAG: type III-B CRISPR module RAMP protein Cmr4 [Bacteroidia bacterium]|nr:type III-B CRISPR module RAMP protein Cmr4 [Bacteroidia bacterium]
MIHSQLVSIVNQANLHVGSGSESSGIIDNLIYRDFTTNLPGIPGSGLKGALRERINFEVANRQFPEADLIAVFGSERNEAKTELMKRGNYYFQEATLLSFPYRGDSYPYYNATSPELIISFLEQTKLFHFPVNEKMMDVLHKLSLKEIDLNKGLKLSPSAENLTNNTAEDIIITRPNSFDITPEIELLFGGNLILVNHSNLARRVNDYNLPFIARNNLDHGISKNLFYEQVLPRYTHFYSFISYESKCNAFEKTLKSNPIVQIGANASIGYGWCKLCLYDSL